MTCEGCSGAVNRVLGRLKGKRRSFKLFLSLSDALNFCQTYHIIFNIT